MKGLPIALPAGSLPRTLGLLALVAQACAAPIDPSAPGNAHTPSTSQPGQPGQTGERVGAVVYGADDRAEWYEISDADLKRSSRETTVAFIGWGDVTLDADGLVTLPARPTLHDNYMLCADQRYRDQPTASFCSGTLIGEDLVLTAAHCIRNTNACANNAVVFDYLYEAEGELAQITADSVYRCVALQVVSGRELSSALDLAILQLDRAVVDRTPARVSTATSVAVDDALVMKGFPNGIPLKVSTGHVRVPRSAGDYFTAAVDAFHGDSGAGVYDADGEVIGVLVDGASDYESAGSCAQVSVLPEEEAIESVMFAHHAVTALCTKGFPSPDLCGIEPSCGDRFCTTDESSETCPGDCTGLFAVPPEWTCNHRWYAAGDDCDCGCGTWDPDCEDPNLDVVNCGVGSLCEPDGTCTVPVPETWTCQRSRYNNGQQCDCDCGAYDPDCDNPNARVVNCAPGGTCQPDGTCTASIPREWTCRARYYDADDGCDCNCGAWDPDCEDPRASVYNCGPGSGCLGDGTCEIPVPAEWVCAPEHYAANDGCDCRCGMLDPDCGPGVEVKNCASGEFCDPHGRCTDVPPVEPEPEPEPAPEPTPEPPPEPGPELVEPEPAPVEEASPEEDGSAAEAEAITGRGGGGGCGAGSTPWVLGFALLLLRLSRPRRARAL